MAIVYGHFNQYHYIDGIDNSVGITHEMYLTDDEKYYVKKIPNTAVNRSKIEKLINIRINREKTTPEKSYLVSAFPIESVYSSIKQTDETWCGYVMRNCADDIPMGDLLVPRNYSDYFGDDKYFRIIRVCIYLCSCFSELHKDGCFLSDIKPDNFLVKRNGRVYPVDVDGFSVHGDLSQMPRPEYSLRKYKDTPFDEYTCPEDNEYFGLAMLLLQMLTCLENISSIRNWDLMENGSDYELLVTKDSSAIESIPKRRFYTSWYLLPKKIRTIFLGCLFNMQYHLPKEREWAELLGKYAATIVSDPSYPPKNYRECAEITSDYAMVSAQYCWISDDPPEQRDTIEKEIEKRLINQIKPKLEALKKAEAENKRLQDENSRLQKAETENKRLQDENSRLRNAETDSKQLKSENNRLQKVETENKRLQDEKTKMKKKMVFLALFGIVFGLLLGFYLGYWIVTNSQAQNTYQENLQFRKDNAYYEKHFEFEQNCLWRWNDFEV